MEMNDSISNIFERFNFHEHIRQIKEKYVFIEAIKAYVLLQEFVILSPKAKL